MTVSTSVWSKRENGTNLERINAMSKQITVDQSHAVMAILATHIDWSQVDPDLLQESVIRNGKVAGFHATAFLKAGARMSLSGVIDMDAPSKRVPKEWKVKDEDQLSRYRFALNAADFLICRACGVYVAAFMPDGDDGGFATLMVNVLDDHARYVRAPTAVEYGQEDERGRRQRRREKWTPATLRAAA